MNPNIILSLPAVLVDFYRRQEVIVLDVRRPSEFIQAHIDQACNIPYEDIPLFLNEIRAWEKAVITCSANGFRAERAADFLNSQNIPAVNGGQWQKLRELLL
ncbi:MAG: rhodanese-like domain-containing protein [Bacteroidota bacterium]